MEQVAEMERRLEETYARAFKSLTAAIHARSLYTMSHCERVADLAREIARAMNLSTDDVERVREGGLVHDLGMIGIRDNVLLKSGSLTPPEREEIRRHPVFGYDMLKVLPRFQTAAAVARCHHERWDGGGYPDGLSGEAIPLSARICAVAEVYDSLTSSTAWRPRWPLEEARDYIVANGGTQFDPSVVDAFIAIASALKSPV